METGPAAHRSSRTLRPGGGRTWWRGVRQLIRLRDLTQTQGPQGAGRDAASNAAQEAVAQVETLRKMLLAMACDMRVVLVRLASCVTTLRHFAEMKLLRRGDLRLRPRERWTCTRRWPTGWGSGS
jgi:ABC-type cobalamin transport system ATPase subunit